jgi:modulator of FtsH protease
VGGDHAIIRGVYDVEGWGDLFVASAGAAAALAGLVFVAISINVERIVAYQGLPERALQTVVLLLAALVVSIVGLVPQDTSTLGLEVLLVGLAAVGFVARTIRPILAAARGHGSWVASRIALVLPGTVLFVIGGISLLVGAGGGLGWVAGGIIGAFLGGVLNGWVLLVEILR